MARIVLIGCDAPGCEVQVTKPDRADALEGWLSRRVIDTVKKTLAMGVQNFDATLQLHYCPEHARSEYLEPPLHSTAAEWLDEHEGKELALEVEAEPLEYDPEAQPGLTPQ